MSSITHKAKAARERGDNTFIHDVECKRCHTFVRSAKGHGGCAQCNRSKNREQRNKSFKKDMTPVMMLSADYLSMKL